MNLLRATFQSQLKRFFAPFACLHCKTPSTQVLCPVCLSVFRPRPQLLSYPTYGIEQLYSIYTMTGVSTSVLRHWKYSGAIGLNSLLFNWPNRFIEQIRSESFSYLIPIPQSEKRTPRQGAARVAELAFVFHQTFKVPILNLFKLSPTKQHNKSLDLISRMSQPNPFLLEPRSHGPDPLTYVKKVALIDDFYTTGQTLSFAAEKITAAYPNIKIIGITLGVRPQKIKQSSNFIH